MINIRVAEMISMNASPLLYDINQSLFLPLLVGVCICAYSMFIAGFGVIIMDKKSEIEI